MRTLALTVAYDGTEWAGFQRQTRAPSIQYVLEDALSNAFQHQVEVAAAGRTDAGVHALGQVVSFSTTNPMPIERVSRVVNQWLPDAVRVRRAEDREADFHARWRALCRRYWYCVQVTRWPDPLRGRFCWQVDTPLDVKKMQAALSPLVGRHDFSAFCQSSDGAPVSTTVRTVQRAWVRTRDRYIIVDVQADAFLRQMMRLLTANLVAIGQGQRPVSWLTELLQSRDRWQAGKGAPARGLCLMRVGYPPRGSSPMGRYDGVEQDEELSG